LLQKGLKQVPFDFAQGKLSATSGQALGHPRRFLIPGETGLVT